jgi:hypothetical protein
LAQKKYENIKVIVVPIFYVSDKYYATKRRRKNLKTKKTGGGEMLVRRMASRFSAHLRLREKRIDARKKRTNSIPFSTNKHTLQACGNQR